MKLVRSETNSLYYRVQLPGGGTARVRIQVEHENGGLREYVEERIVFGCNEYHDTVIAEQSRTK